MKRNYHFLFLMFPLLAFIGCSQSPTSPGGSNQWVKATSNAFSTGRYGLAGTVFNGSMWAVGGASGNADGSVTYYYSDVYSSGSGASWSKVNANAPFGGRYGSQVLSFNGKLWLIGGNSNGTLMNDVWSSPDGINWTNVLASTNTPGPNQFSAREDFGAVVFNNLMWVIGGWANTNKSDVWSSPDGLTWTAATGNAGFASRWGLSATVFNNDIWVFGGASGTSSNSDPTQGYGDVWYSANGGAWTNASTYAGYGQLYYLQVVPSNNQFWLTSGYLWNNWGPQSGVGTSSNGTQWNMVIANYPQRFGHLSLAYNNAVWVIGGSNNVCSSFPCPTTVTYYNDVWSH